VFSDLLLSCVSCANAPFDLSCHFRTSERENLSHATVNLIGNEEEWALKRAQGTVFRFFLIIPVVIARKLSIPLLKP
jgi:hypothetical protein